MLGSSDPYITGCRALAQRLHPKTYEPFNDVAYRAAGAMWVHIAHPSGMNGFFDTWLQGDPADKSGAKMQLARAAVSASGLTAA